MSGDAAISQVQVHLVGRVVFSVTHAFCHMASCTGEPVRTDIVGRGDVEYEAKFARWTGMAAARPRFHRANQMCSPDNWSTGISQFSNRARSSCSFSPRTMSCWFSTS